MCFLGDGYITLKTIVVLVDNVNVEYDVDSIVVSCHRRGVKHKLWL